MPIQVTCQCGQQLMAKDEFAGKRVKCPKCGGPLLVVPAKGVGGGAEKQIADLLDDVGIRANVNRCPGCRAELAEQAVLCVMCGFDLRRGHRIKTRVGSAIDLDDEELGDLPVHGNPVLDNAERQLARDRLEQSRLGSGAPWWMILLAFLGLVGFAAGMVSMPQDRVVENAGFVLIAAGAILSFFYYVRLLIEAFKESPMHGLLSLLVPPYVLYFVMSRWDRVGMYLLISLIGGAMAGAGYVMVMFLVPFFENLKSDKKDDKMGSLPARNLPVAVYYCDDLSRI